MKIYIADSCFWFGLLDNRDAYYETANRIFNRLRTDSVFLIPDPTLYETLNTRMLRNKDGKPRAEKLILNLKTNPRQFRRISDKAYIETAYQRTVCQNEKTSYSFVDNIIRVMLEDKTLPNDGLITFNVADFADICCVPIIDS